MPEIKVDSKEELASYMRARNLDVLNAHQVAAILMELENRIHKLEKNG